MLLLGTGEAIASTVSLLVAGSTSLIAIVILVASAIELARGWREFGRTVRRLLNLLKRPKK